VAVSAVVLAALLSLALAWKAGQIQFSWWPAAADFERAHVERASNPRVSRALLGIRGVLVLIPALVVFGGATGLS